MSEVVVTDETVGQGLARLYRLVKEQNQKIEQLGASLYAVNSTLQAVMLQLRQIERVATPKPGLLDRARTAILHGAMEGLSQAQTQGIVPVTATAHEPPFVVPQPQPTIVGSFKPDPGERF